jgi:hypothetical protein
MRLRRKGQWKKEREKLGGKVGILSVRKSGKNEGSKCGWGVYFTISWGGKYIS